MVMLAARLEEQMFSFSSTHRGLCFNMAGFRSGDGVVGDVDTRWQSKSLLSIPPTYIPNNDVILFIPLYHMAQTGSLRPSVWMYFDFQSLLTPHSHLSLPTGWLQVSLTDSESAFGK